MGLVKQTRVVIKNFGFLIKIVESRILTERLCFILYQNIFRSYFLAIPRDITLDLVYSEHSRTLNALV